MCMNSDVNTRTHVQEINGAEQGGALKPQSTPRKWPLGCLPHEAPKGAQHPTQIMQSHLQVLLIRNLPGRIVNSL